MTDPVERARPILDALERADVAAVAAARSPRLAGWEPGPWLAAKWTPRMEEIAGTSRRVVSGWAVHQELVRFQVEGEAGTAFATVLLDDHGLVGLSIAEEIVDGAFGICISCNRDQEPGLRAFWSALVDGPLGFGEGLARPPRWPDPEFPQQLHLDVSVAELDHAEAAVRELGATRLRDSGAFRVFADPVGHPFCLYGDPAVEADDRIGVLTRVILDGPDPERLATFWSGLLDLPVRVEDTADRIVITGREPRLPMIGFQRAPDHRPPRWPDPDFPAQLHFDVSFDDRESRERQAVRLGAVRLPAQGGSCPVYADPAGHPFCLCFPGE